MRQSLFVILILMFMGCATTATLGQKSTSLKVGMSKDEVTQILGSPKTTSVTKTDEGIIEKWSYWTKKMIGYVVFDDPNVAGSANRLTVTFKDDVVQSWGDQLDYSNMMQQSTQAMKEAMKVMQPIQVEQKIYQAGDKN